MIERQLRDLREGVMRVRMVAVGEIFERMRFVAAICRANIKEGQGRSERPGDGD